MLQKKEGLLVLARKAIRSVLRKEKFFVDETIKSQYSQPASIYVTIKIGSQLRGCFGTLEKKPLWENVIEQAKNAAFRDAAFIPLTEGEYPDIKIEISILSDPSEIKGPKSGIPKQIRIGKDGLVVEKSGSGGLLLPEIFEYAEATPEEALEMTCQRANLDENAWKSHECHIYKFTTEIIKEIED